MTSQLQRRCNRSPRVKCEAILADHEPPDPEWKPTYAWSVTLTYQGRKLTTPFFTGELAGEPTAADVLSCLISDTMSYENAGSFEAWAPEYGYDPDSRKAEAIYRACERQAPRVRRFLGDDFDEFAQLEH
jgi:hypothetical protein